jgi:hypothetical protein
MAAARFNTPEHAIFDYHVVCLAGDGCMQEGVAMEAVEFAGHQKLDNLILIYDSNDVTLDAMAARPRARTRPFGSRRSVGRPDGGRLRHGGLPEGLQPAKKAKSGKAAAHHRQDDHRQGHPRGAGHPEGPRRGRRQVRRLGARRPRAARRQALLRERRRARPILPGTSAGSSARTTAGARPSRPGARPIPRRPPSSTRRARSRARRTSSRRSRSLRRT